MTPAEHIARAELLLDTGPDPTAPEFNLLDLAMSVNALAHCCIAIAVELGAPHPSSGAEVPSAG